MKMKFLAATTLLIVAPSMLTAQSAAARADAQAQATTPDARIEAATQAAVRADVPVSLIESKVAEGRAKGMPEERIAAAVETRVEALVRASESFKEARIEGMTEGELSVAADAVEAGVSQNALVRIGRSAPSERRILAVAVLADLVRLGHASETAYARVSSALTSRAALASLNAEVASELHAGGMTSTLTGRGVIRLP